MILCKNKQIELATVIIQFSHEFICMEEPYLIPLKLIDTTRFNIIWNHILLIFLNLPHYVTYYSAHATLDILQITWKMNKFLVSSK